MDFINLAKGSATPGPSKKSMPPAASATPSATANLSDHLESFHSSQLNQEMTLGLALPSRGQALSLAAQLSGTTWSWIKKVYPECEDNDNEAESCLYSALGELAPPSFEHSNRVGQLAARFAQHLGLTQSQKRTLSRAARFKEAGFVALQMHLWDDDEKEAAAEAISLGGAFHDIGKLSIPRDILNKPGPLNDEERALIELHPLIGESLLQRVPSAHPLLPTVRNHHERWDGKGYPDGLSGEAIPWNARVIAIVDSFDAMTEGRPYRKALTEEEGWREILRGKGTQFDPELAESFAQMFQQNPLDEG